MNPKRHHLWRQGKPGALLSFDREALPDGGLWFGYVQESKELFFWSSVNDVLLDRPIRWIDHRHVGTREDGHAKGCMDETAFDDGGAMPILVDAWEANPRQREGLSRLLHGLAVVA